VDSSDKHLCQKQRVACAAGRAKTQGKPEILNSSGEQPCQKLPDIAVGPIF
jgi:hypothetical protein